MVLIMSATVLVVDDQDVVRDVIRLALEGAGYTVIEAASPQAALELVRDDAQIDLLVTDVVMPEMDAFELAARITSRVPGVRILYTSGYTDARRRGAVHPEALHARASSSPRSAPSCPRRPGDAVVSRTAVTRVLILTASVGEGHDLPARTLADQLREESPDAEVVIEDGLRAMGRGFVLINEEAAGVVFFRSPVALGCRRSGCASASRRHAG